MSSRAATKAMDLNRDFRKGKRMKIPQGLLSATTQRTRLREGDRQRFAFRSVRISIDPLRVMNLMRLIANIHN
jgi:hypothetical protein